ncbi:MAG: redoxin domain-containing protein [Saprospiraceae bacterium]|nr:redoxin domain-containing protein [Bacteroidia bacterium]NNE14853.1 redoxin domain-containing protein [Saprospiraceae bacterium]NNL91895.1 redoxin domain-containing protein [Saprospiraceae bacterium]
MTLDIGNIAPAFSLKNTDLKDISLEDYNGRNVVILFFPLAFTSTCTEELCHMRDNINKYNDLDAQVLAISVDSPFTLKKYKEENALNFPVLSDFNKEVSQKYGAFYANFVLGLKGVAKRAVFIVDKNGMLQYSEVLENAGDLPNFDSLEKALSNLK